MPDTVRLAYSSTEVASSLGCTRQHVENLIRAGVIPSLKLGRRRLIRAQVLDDLLAQLESEAAAQ